MISRNVPVRRKVGKGILFVVAMLLALMLVIVCFLSVHLRPGGKIARSTETPAARSANLRGQLRYGGSTNCVSAEAGTSCGNNLPLIAVVRVVSESGVAAVVDSNADGYFSVALVPGVYEVQPQPTKIDGVDLHAGEQTVSLAAGVDAVIDILYD